MPVFFFTQGCFAPVQNGFRSATQTPASSAGAGEPETPDANGFDAASPALTSLSTSSTSSRHSDSPNAHEALLLHLSGHQPPSPPRIPAKDAFTPSPRLTYAPLPDTETPLQEKLAISPWAIDTPWLAEMKYHCRQALPLLHAEARPDPMLLAQWLANYRQWNQFMQNPGRETLDSLLESPRRRALQAGATPPVRPAASDTARSTDGQLESVAFDEVPPEGVKNRRMQRLELDQAENGEAIFDHLTGVFKAIWADHRAKTSSSPASQDAPLSPSGPPPLKKIKTARRFDPQEAQEFAPGQYAKLGTHPRTGKPFTSRQFFDCSFRHWKLTHQNAMQEPGNVAPPLQTERV